MNDYISREATYQSLTEYYHHTTEGMHSALREAINRIPAAEVRPVVRGKWTLFGRRGIYGVMYECSACHAKYDGRTNFCPNCGADMRPGPPKEENK